MKKFAIYFAMSCCVVGYCQTSAPTAEPFLNPEEVKLLATGKKWIFIRSSDSNKVRWDLRADGNLFGDNLTVTGRDSGKWKVNEQGQVCAEWRGKSSNVCYGIRKKGERTELVAPTFVSELISVE
jgi:hypothetical protein